MPDLPAALDAEVNRLWMAAQARTGGKLFNGRVFNADTIEHDQLCGHWTDTAASSPRWTGPTCSTDLPSVHWL